MPRIFVGLRFRYWTTPGTVSDRLCVTCLSRSGQFIASSEVQRVVCVNCERVISQQQSNRGTSSQVSFTLTVVINRSFLKTHVREKIIIKGGNRG